MGSSVGRPAKINLPGTNADVFEGKEEVWNVSRGFVYEKIMRPLSLVYYYLEMD